MPFECVESSGGSSQGWLNGLCVSEWHREGVWGAAGLKQKGMKGSEEGNTNKKIVIISIY